jgi:hypothetical protein
MPFPAVPSVEQISEPVIPEVGHRTDDRQTPRPSEPDIARRAQPYLDCAIGADVKPAVCIDAVQPAAHVLHPGPESGKRIRLEIDVTEFDYTSARGPN